MMAQERVGPSLHAERMEWSWSDQSLLLPLAFERREWNAVYVAFFLAECTGSRVHVVHVQTGEEKHPEVETFLNDLKEFGRQLKVKFDVEQVAAKTTSPEVHEIADVIVGKASEKQVQAIVMSAHREAYFRELFGRVSDRVARLAKYKVVLVETPHPGLAIPRQPRRLLLPVLGDQLTPDPFIIAAALTSSAAVPEVDLVAARVIVLPMTAPLDAVEENMKHLEQEFSLRISVYIQSLGRLFTPRIIPVREAGIEIAEYAKGMGADLMVLSSEGASGFRGLLTAEEYEVVKRAPCVVLVVFPHMTREVRRLVEGIALGKKKVR